MSAAAFCESSRGAVWSTDASTAASGVACGLARIGSRRVDRIGGCLRGGFHGSRRCGLKIDRSDGCRIDRRRGCRRDHGSRGGGHDRGDHGGRDVGDGCLGRNADGRVTGVRILIRCGGGFGVLCLGRLRMRSPAANASTAAANAIVGAAGISATAVAASAGCMFASAALEGWPFLACRAVGVSAGLVELDVSFARSEPRLRLARSARAGRGASEVVSSIPSKDSDGLGAPARPEPDSGRRGRGTTGSDATLGKALSSLGAREPLKDCKRQATAGEVRLFIQYQMVREICSRSAEAPSRHPLLQKRQELPGAAETGARIAPLRSAL